MAHQKTNLVVLDDGAKTETSSSEGVNFDKIDAQNFSKAFDGFEPRDNKERKLMKGILVRKGKVSKGLDMFQSLAPSAQRFRREGKLDDQTNEVEDFSVESGNSQHSQQRVDGVASTKTSKNRNQVEPELGHKPKQRKYVDFYGGKKNAFEVEI